MAQGELVYRLIKAKLQQQRHRPALRTFRAELKSFNFKMQFAFYALIQ